LVLVGVAGQAEDLLVEQALAAVAAQVAVLLL
jgi:hypothetical protein